MSLKRAFILHNRGCSINQHSMEAGRNKKDKKRCGMKGRKRRTFTKFK
jgi:hypothetical protein